MNSQISISDRLFVNFISSIAFTISAFLAFNFIGRGMLLDYLKNELNKQYIKNFPYIQITTKDDKINGKIQDVFHNDLIVLDDNGIKIVAEWNEITTLKLREKNPTLLDLSHFK